MNVFTITAHWSEILLLQVQQIVAAVEEAHADDGLFVPATVAQQKLIFNPPPPRDMTPKKPRPQPTPRVRSGAYESVGLTNHCLGPAFIIHC